MNADIRTYNSSQPVEYREICRSLAEIIESDLAKAESKIWHGSPVWFLDDNPIVGYRTRKDGVQLLFWSGQSFDEPLLRAEGRFKAANALFTHASQIKVTQLRRWLKKARTIQWDYKSIVKRHGVLEKMGTWG